MDVCECLSGRMSSELSTQEGLTLIQTICSSWCLVQVLRVAMLNAASVARTFLTSDVIITEIPQPEAAGAAGGMEGMGGY